MLLSVVVTPVSESCIEVSECALRVEARVVAYSVVGRIDHVLQIC